MLIVAVAVGLLLRPSHYVSGQEGGLKIGVIDLNRVVRECQMGKDRVKELDAAYKAKRAELQKQRDEVAKLQEELKLLDATSDEAAHKRREFAEKAALLKAQADVAASEWQRKYAAAHKAVYTEIFKVLEKFRKENGFHILLRKDSLDFSKLDPLRVKALLRSNSVLDADPQLDVTDRIIKLLDQTYKAK